MKKISFSKSIGISLIYFDHDLVKEFSRKEEFADKNIIVESITKMGESKVLEPETCHVVANYSIKNFLGKIKDKYSFLEYQNACSRALIETQKHADEHEFFVKEKHQDVCIFYKIEDSNEVKKIFSSYIKGYCVCKSKKIGGGLF